MKKITLIPAIILWCCFAPFAFSLDAPVLSVSSSGLSVSVSWTQVTGATGYTLVYAPYPYTGPAAIGMVDMGSSTALSLDLWDGAAFYLAVTASDGSQTGDFSNIALLQVTAGNQAGDTWTDPATGMVFTWVPQGCFDMGCGSWTSDCDSDELPVHQVCLDGFWMGIYEVTQGQWKGIMGANPASSQAGDDYPVETVSYTDSLGFISALSAQSGHTFRLPTEAEWEYAARSSGKDEVYSGGHDIGDAAWYDPNSGSAAHGVGTKSPNGLGIYDMSGNVWEWCADYYGGDYYANSPKDNPQGASTASSRVTRGGSWQSGAKQCRTTYRDSNAEDTTIDSLGLRLVREE